MRVKHDRYGRIQRGQKVTVKRVENSVRVLAKVVCIHGDKYLPLFERIHSELEQLKKKESMMELARKIANDN
jgi:lactam utilization protein B